MSEPKHSPLPWAWEDTGEHISITGGENSPTAGIWYRKNPCDSTHAKAGNDAEFIVHACNSYYAMRLALQAASSALGPMEALENPDLRALKAQIEENL